MTTPPSKPPAPKLVTNEYNHYTGDRGVCFFCCIVKTLEQLTVLSDADTALLNRYARSVNIRPVMPTNLVCKDTADCDKWVEKQLVQIAMSTNGTQT